MRGPAGVIDTLTAAIGARLNTRRSYEPTRLLWSRGLALMCDHNGGFDYVRKQRGGGRPAIAYDVADFADVREGDLVWVRATSLPHFLEHVLPRIEASFALITGDEDWSIPSDFAGAREILANEHVICWFAQNADGTDTSGKLFSIPIGLDFHTIANGRKWKHWQATPQQQHAELETIKAAMPANRDRLVRAHADFHLNKGVTPGERDSVHSILRGNPNVDFQSHKISRSALWREKTRYAFEVSPRGHGLDCHRTWESLVLGNIPIVKRSPLDGLYAGLPVVIVNAWTEISKAALAAWHDEHHASFDRADVQERLTNEYWIARVRRTLRERSTFAARAELPCARTTRDQNGVSNVSPGRNSTARELS